MYQAHYYSCAQQEQPESTHPTARGSPSISTMDFDVIFDPSSLSAATPLQCQKMMMKTIASGDEDNINNSTISYQTSLSSKSISMQLQKDFDCGGWWLLPPLPSTNSSRSGSQGQFHPPIAQPTLSTLPPIEEVPAPVNDKGNNNTNNNISNTDVISKIIQELDSTFTEDVDFTAETVAVTERQSTSTCGSSSPLTSAEGPLRPFQDIFTAVALPRHDVDGRPCEDDDDEDQECDNDIEESMDPLFFLLGGTATPAAMEPRPLLEPVSLQTQIDVMQQQFNKRSLSSVTPRDNSNTNCSASATIMGCERIPFAVPSTPTSTTTTTAAAAMTTDDEYDLNPREPHLLVTDGRNDDEERFREYQAEQWNERFEELRTYVGQHGHCQVSHHCKNYEVLARWCKRQRYQHKLYLEGRPSTMTKERINALRALGFAWNSHEAVWESRMQELLKYKRLNGHCNVPSVHPENQKLSTWCKCQRRQYKLHITRQKSNMTHERVNRLNAIGFSWEVRPAQSGVRLPQSGSRQHQQKPTGFFSSMMPVSKMQSRGQTV